ncbi:MAG: hypothetical protein QF797_02790 [Alphaproteobacteria bacterium]|jgi:hypothetical protein|nr:hypothetical protein [Alphaproteobacteria bacterium]|tara:strand:+ start:215 stop:553 length:339 start_codon:yes stop_codon:yes gene_type:complete
MSNSDDWGVTLGGLALAAAAVDREQKPTEILEGLARALAVVAKAVSEEGDAENQATILGYVQGSLQDGFDGVSVEAAEAMVFGFSDTGTEAVDTARVLLEQTKLILTAAPAA